MVVGLPASALLQQSASLPLAAERDLAAVLRHEMDRLTPFPATELYWSWRLEGRDREAGRLALRLLLVPKLAAAAALDGLAAAGLRAAVLEVPSGATLVHLPLHQPGDAPAMRRSARLAGWVCAVLAVALAVIPVIRQERAIGRAEARRGAGRGIAAAGGPGGRPAPPHRRQCERG